MGSGPYERVGPADGARPDGYSSSAAQRPPDGPDGIRPLQMLRGRLTAAPKVQLEHRAAAPRGPDGIRPLQMLRGRLTAAPKVQLEHRCAVLELPGLDSNQQPSG